MGGDKRQRREAEREKRKEMERQSGRIEGGGPDGWALVKEEECGGK